MEEFNVGDIIADDALKISKRVVSRVNYKNNEYSLIFIHGINLEFVWSFASAHNIFKKLGTIPCSSIPFPGNGHE